MEIINLTIPDMKSPHCMIAVSAALKTVEGATVKKVAPTTVEIELATAAKSTVVATIEKAGYTVSNK